MMYYYNNDFFPFHMFGFGYIFMILFWALVIWGTVNLVKYFVSNSKSDDARATEILKERYAKGEISKEQFEAMKKDIQK